MPCCRRVFNTMLYLTINSVIEFRKCFSNFSISIKVSKGAKIRNRYNQVPHLTQDTNGKVTNAQIDTINESQEVIPSQQVTTKHI